MAAGKAIVSTAVDGCREVLSEGEHGTARPAPGRQGARGGPRARRSADPKLRVALADARARGVAPATTSARASTRCRRSTTRCCAERPRSGACAGLGRSALRGVGGPARPAARPLPRLRHRRPAPARRRPGLRVPRPRAGELRAEARLPGRNGYVTLSADDYFQRPAWDRLAARASGAAHLRRRARQPVERRGAAPEALRDEGIVFLVPGRVPSRPGRAARRGTTSRPAVPLPMRHCRRERGERRAPVVGGDRLRSRGRASSSSRATRCIHARIHTAAGAWPASLTPRDPDGLRRLRRAARPRRRAATSWRRERAARHAAPRSAPRTSEALRFFEARGRRAARASTRSRRRAARPSSSVPAGRAALRALARRCRRAAAAWRRRRSGRPRSAASSPKHAGRSRSGRAGRVVHLCYPWHVGGCPRRAGSPRRPATDTAFCGKVRGVPLTRAGRRPPPDRPHRRGLRRAASRAGPREPDRAPAPQVGPRRFGAARA